MLKHEVMSHQGTSTGHAVQILLLTVHPSDGSDICDDHHRCVVVVETEWRWYVHEQLVLGFCSSRESRAAETEKRVDPVQYFTNVLYYKCCKPHVRDGNKHLMVK